MARKRRRRGQGKVRTRRRRGRLRMMVWAGMVLVGGAVVVGIVAANLSGSSPTVTADDRILGAATAPVTIVEYGDFKCPFCTRFFVETEPLLRSQYIDTGLVRLVWRDFPNIDAESPLAAEAGRCADDQDRFWEFHDTLYTFIWDTYYGQGINVEGRSAYGERLDDLAGQAGLDVDQFRSCLDDGAHRDLVEQDFRGGQAQGVRGTPTFFINGERVVGAQPFEVFRQLIDSKLPSS